MAKIVEFFCIYPSIMCIVRNLLDRPEATRLPVKRFRFAKLFLSGFLRHGKALNRSINHQGGWAAQATHPSRPIRRTRWLSLDKPALRRSRTGCTSAELISVSPDKSSIHGKYDLSSNRSERFFPRLTHFTRCLMAVPFDQPLGIIGFHPTTNNITSMLNITKIFEPQTFQF